ncbi:hypothetical protein [Roseobacter weihaiensis]|uniref:hypothetical protein n=1 Tax=Roseobacter weihaiensis TaxID=2763262 RepID=UPI001D0A1D23|nr:hypothetical protein [Roseobacter sp. H9]
MMQSAALLSYIAFKLSGEIVRNKMVVFAALCGAYLACAGSAHAKTFEEYLASMDRKPVTFSGKIFYNDSNFRFYSNAGEFFTATMDAGREIRERIEDECQEGSFMIDTDELCSIKGSGSVEIRGSDIRLSIEAVEGLETGNQ